MTVGAKPRGERPYDVIGKEYVLGGLVALQNVDRKEYLRTLGQMAIAVLLHRVTQGQPFTFSIDEYLEAMRASPGMSDGLGMEREEFQITIQHTEAPPHPMEQMLRQMGFMPEGEDEAQEAQA